jgi:hypothetical protein
MTSGQYYLLIVFIVVIPAALVGVCVLASSAARQRRETLLMTTGRHTVGRVLELGRSDDGLGLVNYWIRVEYDYDGQTATARVGASQREQQRYQVGQRVGLTFATSRPTVVRLDPPDWPVPRPRMSKPA